MNNDEEAGIYFQDNGFAGFASSNDDINGLLFRRLAWWWLRA
ncbi:MAG: hypothetical protein SVY53_07865 [Chloroflexota bacterium]|nr:hypothetical protein [Chloroflexota bacterium]